MKIAILGAGLAGLELGRILQQRGIDFRIYEKENRVGGLAKTNETEGYLWDYGVHAMYTKDKLIHERYLNLPLDYGSPHTRNVKVLHKGKLIDYPFENGIRQLPWRDRWECVEGYLGTRALPQDCYNLGDWIHRKLGRGIAKHFMLPYNEKIWSCSLSEISTRLVSNKIEPMSVSKFLLTALGVKTIGRIYQSKFLYPQGGIQELVDHLAKPIQNKIYLNHKIGGVNYNNGRWRVCGDKVDKVVSTVPLPELLKRLNIKGIPKEQKELKWNDTHFTMVGLQQGCDFDKFHNCHWVFFKEDEIFYRLTFMHNFSKSFLPTVVAEVTDRGEKDVGRKVIDGLINARVLKTHGDIAVTKTVRVPYTYPIPTIQSKEVVDQIERRLRSYNLHLLGRNGRWQYINMDGILKEVDEHVEDIISNSRRD